MFTLKDIAVEIRKIKSFAGFSGLLDEFAKMGMTKYDNFNVDGKSVYYGKDGYKVEGNAKFRPMEINDKVDVDFLKKSIKSHQNEESNLGEFTKEMADAGADLYTVDVVAKEVIYYDKDGFEILRSKVR